MPQPKAPDADLKAYLWTDAATKKIEKVADAVASTGSGVMIGIGVALAFFVAVKIAK